MPKSIVFIDTRVTNYQPLIDGLNADTELGTTNSGSSYDYNYDFALARYNIDGSLNSPFFSGGKTKTSIGSLDTGATR